MAKNVTKFPSVIFMTIKTAGTEEEYLVTSKNQYAAVTVADSNPVQVATYSLTSVTKFKTAVVEE